jgi:precorrin-6B methylase 2
VQIKYQNPAATNPLFLPVMVICNTTDEVIEQNIRINSEKDLKWLQAVDPHEGIAVLVGGGASIEDEIDTIRTLVSQGGVVFAMNAASQWLRSKGIEVDYQCVADAKEETAQLLDPLAKQHIIGSQVHPTTMDAVTDPIVWHLGIKDIEDLFPKERVKKGGYVILGGGRAVGNSATCVAFALGFRDLRIFGFDSCHKDGRSHAYTQTMNALIPTMTINRAGREFVASVAMKAQAEKFMFTSHHLKQAGCKIQVYGDGLLQTMYNTPRENMTEQEKYQLMWQFDTYREVSPGEQLVELILSLLQPDALILDFGCGTGRASVELAKRGHDVLLIDFADNCRDEEAMALPLLEWDLCEPIPPTADYGICCDVLEHIRPDQVGQVVSNIMAAADKVFFSIGTAPDQCGALIQDELHLTVRPHEWWVEQLQQAGTIQWQQQNPIDSWFVLQRTLQ